MRASTIILLILTCLPLQGCGTRYDTPLDLYLERLGGSLDTDIAEPARVTPALPRARELRILLSSPEIDLLDLLALSDCSLQVTIARRNSSLGKVAPASQRLLMDLEFLQLAPECIHTLEQDAQAELAETLRSAAQAKREQLPAIIWNATLGGPEFREFWKQPATLGNYPERLATSLPTDLQRLANLSEQWLDGAFGSGHSELEVLLARVRSGDGGALLAALTRQAGALEIADLAIEERTEKRPLCFQGRPSPQGTIFETVVRRFFIEQVQPWAVQIDQRRRVLMPPVLALESLLSEVTPPDYRQWKTGRDAVLETATTAPRRHARGIFRLLEICGLQPGNT